jgi:flagellar biosynthesis anti-sigma factor FlgM
MIHTGNPPGGAQLDHQPGVSICRVAPRPPAPEENPMKVTSNGRESARVRAAIAADDAFDHVKVERIAKAIAAGTFRVDGAAIAERLVQDALHLAERDRVRRRILRRPGRVARRGGTVV